MYKMLFDDKCVTKISNVYKIVHASDVFSLENNLDKPRGLNLLVVLNLFSPTPLGLFSPYNGHHQ